MMCPNKNFNHTAHTLNQFHFDSTCVYINFRSNLEVENTNGKQKTT